MKVLFTLALVAVGFMLLKPSHINESPTEVIQSVNLATPPAAAIEKEPTIKKLITTLDLSDDQVLNLSSPVDEMSTANLIAGIKGAQKSGKPVYILIDSPGGSVIDGAMVISAMEASKVPVNTICLKMCASMAFMIHQYGTTRMAVDRSILMAHPASGGVNPGQIENQMSLLGTINRYITKMDAHIANRAGLSTKDFKNMIAHELWLDAEDATAQHFNDKIVNLAQEQGHIGILPLPSDELRQRLRNFQR